MTNPCGGEDLAAIRCQIVAHRKQRYDTVGDYWRTPARVWLFRISRMKDRRYVWLVFLHELIEWAICRLQRISMRAIDAFDMRYEKSRRSGAGKPPCGCPFGEEPGDDVHAPYHDAHMVATQCERLIAKALNVDWLDYAEAVEALHARP